MNPSVGGTDRPVTIKARHSTSGTDSVLQFYTHQIDLAYVGITPFLMARAYGVPVRAVGTANQFARSHAVVARPDWNNRRLVRVGVVWGSTAHLIGHEWSKVLDRPASFVNLPLRDQLKALNAGFIDAMACWDPYGAAAERAGHIRVFDATNMLTPSYNLICASDELIAHHPRAVRRFVDSHRRGVGTIINDASTDLAQYIGAVFDSRFSPQEFLRILRDHHVWPTDEFFTQPDESHEAWTAIRQSAEFLREIHHADVENLSAADCFAEVPDTGTMPEVVRFGHSDSLMCVPFHASVFTGDLLRTGFHVDPTTRTLSERIAQLDAKTRQDLIGARSLLETDVNAAVFKVGTVHEFVINALYLRALNSPPSSRISATLAELERNRILPPRLVAGAHFIRSLRNAATHDATAAITATEAERALAQLLDILDYSREVEVTAKRRCRRCDQILEADWLACPMCGLSARASCANCSEPVRPDWKACPQCGHPVVSPEGAARVILDACLIYECTVARRSDRWVAGPVPIATASTVTDRKTRSDYFEARAGQVLYGTQRYHQGPVPGSFVMPQPGSAPGVTVWAWELLMIPGRTDAGFVVAHAMIDEDAPDQALFRLARGHRAGGAEASPVLAGLPDGVALEERSGRPYILVWADLVGQQPVVDPMPGYPWSTAEKWLWILASATPLTRYPPAVSQSPRALDALVEMSRTWTACVLRDGAAFVVHEGDNEPDRTFVDASRLFVHSIYLDSFLLGGVQRRMLNEFADQTAKLLDHPPRADEVAALQYRFSAFRSRLWWQHITGHGAANTLLAHYQRQHALIDLHSQLTSELNDYSQQVQTASSVATNSLVGAVTVVALPIAIGFSVAQVLDVSATVRIVTALILAAVLSVVLAVTRVGRQLVRDAFRRSK